MVVVEVDVAAVMHGLQERCIGGKMGGQQERLGVQAAAAAAAVVTPPPHTPYTLSSDPNNHSQHNATLP
jgi:hypothetical protein